MSSKRKPPPFSAFPHIHKLQNVVRGVHEKVRYCGRDEDGHPMFDADRELPSLTFEGTVKLHGTNAAVGFDSTGVFTQSRTRMITPQGDNAGFSASVFENEPAWMSLMGALVAEMKIIPTPENPVYVYGEYCGGHIQKNMGISKLPKMFVCFDVKFEDTFYGCDFECLRAESLKVYSICDFPTYSVTIDFNNPSKECREFMDTVTQSVEGECPVAKHFGIVHGLGEGVVWKCCFRGQFLRFKVKGEKHRATTRKGAVSVDPEVMKSIQEFVNRTVTSVRLEQGLEHVDLNLQKIGEFGRWIVKDIEREEADTLEVSTLVMKGPLEKLIKTKSCNWFKDQVTTGEKLP